MPGNEPLRHHTVQKAILDFFVEDGQRCVWVYRPNRQPVPQLTKDTAVQCYFYGFQEDNGVWNVSIELGLAEIENEIPSIIRNWLEGINVNQLNRIKLARYAALQLVRTPAAFKATREAYGRLNQRELAQIIAKKIPWAPRNSDINQIQEIESTDSALKGFFLMNMIAEMKLKGPLLHRRGWKVWRSKPPHYFITSSTGFGIHARTGQLTIDVLDEACIHYFPLHPLLALEIHGPYNPLIQFHKANAQTVSEINNAIAFTTDSFVVSNRNDLRLPTEWCCGDMRITPWIDPDENSSH
jgi:hypothetical protein